VSAGAIVVSRTRAARRARCALAVLLLAVCAPAVPFAASPPAGAPPAAGGRLEQLSGHLAIGYAKARIDTISPGGSITVAAGLDYRVAANWKAGVTVGYELLGSKNVNNGGSLYAAVDYSVLEVVGFAHWEPPDLGPVNRISLGPGLFSAHADLVAAAGGAAFSRYAREEIAPGVALDFTVMRRKPAPVRIGIELGTRLAFLPQETWILAAARVAFHY
jgi:hypothetical protein